MSSPSTVATSIKLNDTEVSKGRDGITTAAYTLQVTMDCAGSTAGDAIAATGLVIGGHFDQSTWFTRCGSNPEDIIDLQVNHLRIDGISSKPFEEQADQIYLVTVSCSGLNLEYGGSDTNAPAGPNTIYVWDIHFDGGCQQFQEPLSVDRASSPVECRNLAGEPLSPPLMSEEGDNFYTWNFSRNTICPEVSGDDYLKIIDNCTYKINSDTVSIDIAGVTYNFAPYTLKCLPASKSYDDFNRFWKFSLTLAHRPTTFIQKVQSQSTYVLNAAGTALVPMKDVDGNDLTTPQFHTSDGKDYVHNGSSLPTPLSFQVNYAVAFGGTGAGGLLEGLDTPSTL